jgi:gamma-tubulin complex component 3
MSGSASEDPSTNPLNDQFSYMGLHTVPPLPQSDLPPLPGPAHTSSDDLQTKAAILAAHRQPMNPSERDLLRDIPYLLLGLPSTHFPLQGKSLSLPNTLPAPIISLLYSLAEPGLLYKSLQTFIATEESGEDNVGLVGQSLRGAVKGELSGWMNLVAGIEGEIRRFLAQPADDQEGGVTLKRCAIWVREGTLGLRLMSVIIEDTNGTHTSSRANCRLERRCFGRSCPLIHCSWGSLCPHFRT